VLLRGAIASGPAGASRPLKTWLWHRTRPGAVRAERQQRPRHAADCVVDFDERQPAWSRGNGSSETLEERDGSGEIRDRLTDESVLAR
jgi:hypothetical protein